MVSITYTAVETISIGDGEKLKQKHATERIKEQEKTLQRILEMYWNIFTDTEIC